MYLRRSKPKYVIQYKFRFYLILIVFSLGIILTSALYYFDKIVAPTVLMAADSEMRAKTVDIINKNISEIYTNSSDFVYDDIVSFDKGENGKINMMKVDSVKLNALATELATVSQKQIKDAGSIGVKMPIGYITKNNILSYLGPTITVKMEPIGRVETTYESTFESAGINQTNHKIYINIKTNLKIVLPLQSREVVVKHQVPISDVVIQGEVPRTSIGVDSIKKAVEEEVENAIDLDTGNVVEQSSETTPLDILDFEAEFK